VESTIYTLLYSDQKNIHNVYYTAVLYSVYKHIYKKGEIIDVTGFQIEIVLVVGTLYKHPPVKTVNYKNVGVWLS